MSQTKAEPNLIAENRKARFDYFIEDRYEAGMVDFLEVLDAQRTLLEAQDVLAQSDSTISLDLVSLYKALGGGWETQPVTQ